jgi:glutaredoxin
VPSTADESEPRVLVLTRPGCHLCEEAISVVESVVAETGDSYEERNVDRDPELLRRYSEQVPVIFVDGRQHDFWRVDPARLRAALRKAR